MVAFVKSECIELRYFKLEKLFDCWKAVVWDFVKIVLILAEFHLFQVWTTSQSAASLSCHRERAVADFKRLQCIKTRVYQSRQGYLTHIIESDQVETNKLAGSDFNLIKRCFLYLLQMLGYVELSNCFRVFLRYSEKDLFCDFSFAECKSGHSSIHKSSDRTIKSEHAVQTFGTEV
jgi:hypothetical protein